MSHQTLFEQLQVSIAPGPFYEPDATNAAAPRNPNVRLIAFYLPQFHSIPENDAWWGAGFTEWTNVTKAVPRFVGHVQPRLPADLGFYDLRNPDVLHHQARLARRYGIGGFCFHYYWFSGRRLLETPLELLLADPSLDLPFCVNWANENWTRRWDGLESDVLMAQTHSPQDDHQFARSLATIVRDPRYIKVDGRPLVMIYRPGLLPEPVATMRRWRTEFARAGVGNPYIVMAQAFDEDDPRLYGVDAAAQFPPQKLAVTRSIKDELSGLAANFDGVVVDYSEVAHRAVSVPTPPYKLFRTVCPNWDNDPRKPARGLILANSTPAKYGDWLSAACHTAVAESAHSDERIVFVNAWNEWAEGAYLEPDRHFGHAYLAETARVLTLLENVNGQHNEGSVQPRIGLVLHDAHRHGAQLNALALTRTLVTEHNVRLTVLLGGPGELAAEYAALAPTEIVPGNFADMTFWRDAARRLAASGVTAVFCNTLVSAQAIGPLREEGLRVIQLVHELPSLIRQYGLEAAAREAAAHAAAIVFASAHIRDRFLEVVGQIRNRAVLRHQGIYVRRLSADERRSVRAVTRRALGIADNQLVVLGVGYGDVRKGLDLWPRLGRQVLKECPDAVFLWVGRVDPGLRHWLEHDLRMIGLERRVVLVGESTDMAGMYAAADAYVLTSREDPFPSVVIEAMANGLPTVVFDASGGIVELVRNAGGVSVPYLDVDAMARELVRLLHDSMSAAAMGASLAARINHEFDYKDYGAALLALAVPPVLAVSVVVPNYNYARHLRRRLESIWAQRALIREIILLDDASTDDSHTVIRELMRESPVPIRVAWNATNSGSVSQQWARGVSLAEGDLVWIAEADDFADPDFLAAVLPAFEDPEVVLSYSESRMVNENGELLAPNYLGYVSDISTTRWTEDFCRPGLVELVEALSIKNTIPNVSAVIFRRDALAAVLNNYLEEMTACRNAADWLCYIHLLAQGGSVTFTARALNNHRRHATSVTVASVDLRHLKEIAAMQDLAASIVPIPSETRAIAMQYRRVVADQFDIPYELIPSSTLTNDA
jgi:O-antigen biosynthesis protein